MIPTAEQEQVWREEWMATAASATSNEKRLLKWDSTMAGYMMGRRVAQAELEALRSELEEVRAAQIALLPGPDGGAYLYRLGSELQAESAIAQRLTELGWTPLPPPPGSSPKPPASESECPTCHNTGRQFVGHSGQESDGNAPMYERCGECGYGSEPPASEADRVKALEDALVSIHRMVENMKGNGAVEIARIVNVALFGDGKR